MQEVKKEDMPKLIGLIIATLGVFGYFLYSYLFAQPQVVASPQKPGEKPGAVASPGATGGEQTATATPAEEIMSFEAVRPPVGGRDPFKPLEEVSKNPGPAPQPSRPVPPIPPIQRPVPQVAQAPRKRIPPTLSGLLSETEGNRTGSGVRPINPGPPPPPNYVVTSIILGDPTTGNARNIAVLRSPQGDERRFVSVGDPVGNGYTVVAVYADGVEIKDRAGNRRVTLRLGQSGDKARAN